MSVDEELYRNSVEILKGRDDPRIWEIIAYMREHLRRGAKAKYAPDYEDESRCQIIFDTLSKTTHEQLKALETFAEIDWSVR
jgi:hypothetical protein